MRKTRVLANEIRELNWRMRELRKNKKAVVAEENEQILAEGIERFRNNPRSMEFRLLGQDHQDEWKHKSDYEEYYALCEAFEVALFDLKEFYRGGKHLPIIERLIDNQDRQHEKRDLLKIFKQTRYEREQDSY